MKMISKQNKECKYLAEALYAALDMERSIVGVKLFKREGDYKQAKGAELQKPINYCQMVAAASRGNTIKATEEKMKCGSGIRVLGFDHQDSKNSNGQNWVKLGIHETAEVSREVRKRIESIPEKTSGILVQPLEKYMEMPDVILIVTTPYNIMRLTQGYGYYYGTAEQINMAGNQAICLECTAAPYINGDINISTLCIGTRHQAGWEDTEMAIGISGDKVNAVVDGVIRTINIMESDSNKKRIEERMKEKKIACEEMRYQYNYYMDC